MSKKVKPIPEGFHTITPFLIFQHAMDAIKFYKNAFGAEEVERHMTPDNKVLHAVLKIGNSLFMLSDIMPEFESGVSTPRALKGTTALFHLYVEDVDAAFNQAIKAGAKVHMPVDDMFWGDRYGQLEDPFGHLWSIATHIAEPSMEEVEEEMQQCCNKSKSCQH